MKYTLKPTGRFQKDLKKAQRRGYNLELDWLLIYEINKTELILYLTRTGTHSDLF
jgi:addiction module toxin, relE/stbE family